MSPACVSPGALLLLQGMRHEYEAVQAAKGSQDSEMRAMKERMMLGVSFQSQLCLSQLWFDPIFHTALTSA